MTKPDLAVDVKWTKREEKGRRKDGEKTEKERRNSWRGELAGSGSRKQGTKKQKWTIRLPTRVRGGGVRDGEAREVVPKFCNSCRVF